MSESGLGVYKAISTVQGELAKRGISKDQQNKMQGFKYRGIDDVYAALCPLLASNGLCILPKMVSKTVVERTNAKGTALFYTTVEVDFDIVSSEDGSRHTVSSYGEAMDSGDKSAGKAMSYAYKAMAFMVFAIPTEGDNDPDANVHTVMSNKEPSKPAPLSPAVRESVDKYVAQIAKLETLAEVEAWLKKNEPNFSAAPVAAINEIMTEYENAKKAYSK